MEPETNSPKSVSTLLAVLVKRKKIFALSLVILTLAGLPWALSTPMLHFYKATFMMGQTEINPAANRQDSAQSVISLLEEVIIPEAKSELAEQWPDVTRMTINLRLTNNPRLIALETRIAENETQNAAKLYGVILEKLVSQQSENYFTAHKKSQNQLQIREAAQQLQQSAVETTRLKKFLTQPLPSNTQLTTTNKSLNDNKEQLYQLLNLESQVNQNLLDNSLMSIQPQDQLTTIKSPKIVMQPALSLQPTGPHRSLKIMIIFSLAFIGAAFLVFSSTLCHRPDPCWNKQKKRDLK